MAALVLGGRDAKGALECLGEGEGIGVAAGTGHLADGQCALQQQLGGPLHAEAHQELLGRDMEGVLEYSGEIAAVQTHIEG